MTKTRSFDADKIEVLNISKRGDGRQRVLKLCHAGTPYILKCYGLKTSRRRAVMRELGSLTVAGKSSIRARARCKTEREVLRLWMREGFDVPRLLSIEPPLEIQEPYLVLEWIPGCSLYDILESQETSLVRKEDLISRFAALMEKRHARALELHEPRLLFERPTFEHVLISGDRLIHFDFEIVFTSKSDIGRFVRREIVGFLHSLAKSSRESFGSLLDTFVAAYPDSKRFDHVRDDLIAYGAVPVAAWLEPVQRFSRKWQRYSKRSRLAAALEEALRFRERRRPDRRCAGLRQSRR